MFAERNYSSPVPGRPGCETAPNGAKARKPSCPPSVELGHRGDVSNEKMALKGHLWPLVCLLLKLTTSPSRPFITNHTHVAMRPYPDQLPVGSSPACRGLRSKLLLEEKALAFPVSTLTSKMILTTSVASNLACGGALGQPFQWACSVDGCWGQNQAIKHGGGYLYLQSHLVRPATPINKKEMTMRK